jgi:phage gpG-like protein
MRELRHLRELVHVFEQAAVQHEVALGALTAASARVLHEKVRHVFGDETKLAELADATQEERVRLGYSPNDPLLRDGRMLRDSIEEAHSHDTAGVGSAEPVMVAHEYGYYNVRAQRNVPARPVFHIAMDESAPEIEEMINEALSFTFSAPASVELKP